MHVRGREGGRIGGEAFAVDGSARDGEGEEGEGQAAEEEGILPARAVGGGQGGVP